MARDFFEEVIYSYSQSSDKALFLFKFLFLYYLLQVSDTNLVNARMFVKSQNFAPIIAKMGYVNHNDIEMPLDYIWYGLSFLIC